MSDLRDALRISAQEPGPASRAQVARAIHTSTVFVPLTRDSTDTSLKLLIVRNPKDRPLMVGFTDLGALRAWSGPDRGYVEVPASSFLADAQRAAVDAVYIDPKSPDGVRIPLRDVVAMLEGVEVTHEADGADAFRVPDVPRPTRPLLEGEFAPLVEALRRVCLDLTGVQDAFVLSWKIGEGEEHPLIGLRFEETTPAARRHAAFAELRKHLGPMLRPTEYVDFIEIDPSYASDLRRSGAAPAFSRNATPERTK